ncbi:exopolysaccharide transport family protein [Parapedobacter koreensis]|uniref:Uncharacterized protein involved in exopolysaccharide biosynthesis n=1 Tax=Parapedobacter koreensis TaxID=332977 RepID=A0A1H7IJ06_9SPHI|nr:Wzz/FepE/Etk N-terminal domain-containing protein [Parapedobacter koreensis]SEK62491.1 Uncharacterized protein involved in exopolysaccharide biosynthesis [Parapedobacter koreensis]
MIDLNAFFRYLWKYSWVILAVVVVSVVTTFFLVKKLPEDYTSQAQLATEAPAQLIAQGGEGYEYGNIVEMMKMRRVINLLSYRLIIHDLENPDKAFRTLPEEIAAETRQDMVAEYKRKLFDRSILTVSDEKLFDIVNTLGYGEKKLLSALTIQQGAESNLIKVEFISEDPDLSAFAVNTFCTEFIDYYNSITNASNTKSLQLLDSLRKEKEQIMNDKNAQLQAYKSSSGVLNVATQSGIVYQQVSEYESRLSQTNREIESLRSAIARINNQLNSLEEPAASAPAPSQSNNITKIDDEISRANQRYIDNGMRPADKTILDSLQKLRVNALSATPRRSAQATNTSIIRQSLISERMDLETSLALAEGSIASTQQGLAEARRKYNVMVPTDAGIQRYERDADLATKDYTEALNRYNQASLGNTVGLKLNLVEPGLPGLPESSKRIMYTGLSGVASFSLSFAILFIAFLLDHRIINAQQLASVTKGKVIGNLNLIKRSDKDLRSIWKSDGDVPDYNLHKDLLRSLRFEINKQLSAQKGEKVLGITSLSSNEGKTFITMGLAYAYAMTGKRVLLIGEDYPDLLNLITNTEKSSGEDKQHTLEFEKFLVKKEIQAEDFITVLNRNSNSTSLLEMKDSQNLIAGFDVLRREFDIILIDINSLKDINKVKEWLMFVDKCIAIFASGNSIKPEDEEFISFINNEPTFMGWVLNKIPVKHYRQKITA